MVNPMRAGTTDSVAEGELPVNALTLGGMHTDFSETLDGETRLSASVE